ncbi:MAG: phospholipase D family protein [Variovorax sp.]|nr:MAG: phospholipase D family protein [Variovorax sp.]
MPSSSFTLPRALLAAVLAVTLSGCGTTSGHPSSQPQVEVAFSPKAGSEALIIKVIDSAHKSLRLAAYSFTSPTIVRALINAKRRGVDVRVLIDDKGNRGKSNIAAMNLVVGADIPTRVISTYTIHHDKYIVVDSQHTQTGSFNYSQAAAAANSENVLVVWNNPTVASTYLAHWESRWAKGTAVEMGY